MKPTGEFPRANNIKRGHQAYCKACHAAQARKRDYRPQNLMRFYGITVEQFDAMLVEQGGVCKVCSGPAMGKGRYHVDHDHETGLVRGLLCHKCNVALGMVRDSISHLQALIDYLGAHVNSVTRAFPVAASEIPVMMPVYPTAPSDNSK